MGGRAKGRINPAGSDLVEGGDIAGGTHLVGGGLLVIRYCEVMARRAVRGSMQRWATPATRLASIPGREPSRPSASPQGAPVLHWQFRAGGLNRPVCVRSISPAFLTERRERERKREQERERERERERVSE